MALEQYVCKKHGPQAKPQVQFSTKRNPVRSCRTCRKEANQRFKGQQPKCHPERKRRSKDLCAPCWRATLDVAAQREHERDYGRKWRAKNPGRDSTNVRNSRLRRRYGVSPEQYAAMNSRQGGLCAICRKPQVATVKRLGVDHNHSSGQARDLLCNPCNLLVGHVERNPALVEIVMAYLLRHAQSKAA